LWVKARAEEKVDCLCCKELMKKEGYDLATASSIRTSVGIIANKNARLSYE